MITRTNRTSRMLALAAGTALASTALAGCATNVAPRADLSASKAEVAMTRGDSGSAITNAEAAVLADPRNASYRTMLGAAYMDAGRFLAARTSFDDAMTLGDTSPRTVLGFALASVAAGDRAAALRVLSDYGDDIAAADLGLALALAGEPQQGAFVLSNALRSGDNTPKVRQNLAYALALGGDWAGARIMAAEDVPADQLGARLTQWAALSTPDQSTNRVAALLGTRAVADAGQPVQLALANHPSHGQLVAEAAAVAAPVTEPAPAQEVAFAGGELPPVGSYAPAAQPAPVAMQVAVAAPAPAPTPVPSADFDTAFAAQAPSGATPAQMIASAAEFVAQPVIQQAPTRVASAKPVRKAANRTVAASQSGDHLVQLGSFSSEASAQRAWAIYAKRFPQLSAFDMVITKAVVRGKTYYRVSAGGLQRAQASSVCSTVRGKGEQCIAWAEGRPLPGAVNTGVRMARR
ncbi:SPOR domain-containing protein [Altererythrobacter sp. TH136]|uniref:SPOR domain-containing protein n=1 Tax=Altererythrobacter sp. TH136 TaxID=2067415 RepID=UPI001163BBE6|nr:SPOR domain-containing protein [Altererythrobacter sp. TH136]QDM41528.1 SPOR domain-containing protein [Altererythrobacter sp. TH136]